METENKKVGVIYGLYEPETPLPFYIGMTTQPRYQHRLSEHICESKRGDKKNIYKERLICKLLEAGFKPEIRLIEEVSGSLELLKEREVFWIAELKPRTNSSPGGDWNPMLSDKREQAIAKIKLFAANKRKEAAEALGITEEELAKQRKAGYIKISKVNRANHPSCQPEAFRKYVKERRAFRREVMGEEAWKKLVADEKRNWYANLSPEQKEEQRRRDREYRQRRRDKRKQANVSND